MIKSFRYRIYPTYKQSVLIDRHIGACRFIYNLALETKVLAFNGNKVTLTSFDLIKQLPDLKKECTWLKEINSQSLQQSIFSLETAFTLFFKGVNNFPKFKKKSNTGSFSCTQKSYIKNNKLRLPKFKTGIKIVLDRLFIGEIKVVEIKKVSSGKYFASFICDDSELIPEKPLISEDSTIGIDLGLKSFLTTSDGECIDIPKFFRKMESKISFLDRKFNKYKGKRTKRMLSITHEKVSNRRKDFLHKTSTKLIRENQSIAVEDLNLVGMRKLHNISKSVSDASFGRFIEMLKYKAKWYGKNILVIGRFDPSSKMCSCCGRINKSLSIQEREWTCECGAVLLRDVNAAINIKNFALKNHLSDGFRLKNRDELPTLVGVLTPEAQ